VLLLCLCLLQDPNNETYKKALDMCKKVRYLSKHASSTDCHTAYGAPSSKQQQALALD
jgi:hypothetical protein